MLSLQQRHYWGGGGGVGVGDVNLLYSGQISAR